MATSIVLMPEEEDWLLPVRAVFDSIERDGGLPVIEVYAGMKGIDEQVKEHATFEDAMQMLRALNEFAKDAGLPPEEIEIGVRVRRVGEPAPG